jgi:signal transduction histidine kinase
MSMDHSNERETVALVQRTLDPRVRLSVDEPAELGSVLADAGEMSQVLLNLCLNARGAMPEGGVLRVGTCARTISEEHARNHIDARSGDVVCLSVEDTGPGIAPEARGRIFEPFFTTKEPGSGTGCARARDQRPLRRLPARSRGGTGRGMSAQTVDLGRARTRRARRARAEL